MVFGLSGWMDGGKVSTGTVGYLVRKLRAPKVGRIESEGFYIYNLPGSMEVSALFRPHTKIEDGLIVRLEPPSNTFYCSQADNLILFQGKEPNLNWEDYADCVFAAAEAFGVTMIYFIGTVAGVVPHTRDPRLYGSVSNEALRGRLEQYGIRFSNYEGPASIATYLTEQSPRRGVGMAALVAEIPAYVQGANPRSLEAVTRMVSAILGLSVSLDDLRELSDRFEKKVNKVVEKRQDLADLIRKMEEDYDNEMFDTQMGDLKEWLEKQGIRLD
jgi:proteasome assembly chaperone (PAC2) family protein